MAVAASLNVNLTATSGQFASTMTKAGSTLQRLGKNTTSISRSIQGFLAVETIKKGVSFITRAVGEIEDLAKSAENAGFAFNAMDKQKLGGVQVAAQKAAAAIDAMKLRLLIGLAPAIEYVSQAFQKLSTVTVNGFNVMEQAAKAVGATVIVIGKTFNSVFLVIRSGVTVLQAAVAKLSAGAAKALDLVGASDKAKEMKEFAAVLEKAAELSFDDLGKEWADIFKWPEAKANLDGIKVEAKAAAKEVKAITAPEAISFGSQASALFDFRRREARIRAKQEQQINKPKDDKQVSLLNDIKKGIQQLVRLQGETELLTA